MVIIISSSSSKRRSSNSSSSCSRICSYDGGVGEGGSCFSGTSSKISSCTVLVLVVENVDNNVRTGKMGKKRNSCRIYYGIHFEDVLLEGQEGDGRIT